MKIFVRIFSIIGMVIGLVMMAFTLGNDDAIYNQNYTYTSELVDSNLNGMKIVQLTDFHNHSLNYKNGYLPSLVKAENPDVIFITGDVIDQYTTNSNISNLSNFFDELKDYPIYYVEGNHESYASHRDEFFKIIFSHQNVHYLYDTFVKVHFNSSSFNLVGLRDPYAEEQKFDDENDDTRIMEPALKSLSSSLDDELSILLSHRPSMMNLYTKYKMDLVFSGHTHGGQINIIPYTKYLSGKFVVDNTTLIVSNGIGSNGKMPIRFNCPMQLVTCTLKSK